MQYTRKEILKKGLYLSMVCTIPPVLYSVTNILKDNDNDLLCELNECIKPDIIILDESSINNFDFIALKYNKKTDNAPWMTMSKNNYYNSATEMEFKTVLHSIKIYALKNDIFIYSNKKQKDYPAGKLNYLIKSIKECCNSTDESVEISKDLYMAVSFIYADYYNYLQEQEARSRHGIV